MSEVMGNVNEEKLQELINRATKAKAISEDLQQLKAATKFSEIDWKYSNDVFNVGKQAIITKLESQLIELIGEAIVEKAVSDETR